MYTATIDSSANNIPTTFGTGAGSKIISSCPSGGALTIINGTDSVLYVSWGSFPGVKVPSSTLPGTMVAVPPAPSGGSGVGYFDKVHVAKGDSVFIMTGAGSARSSGSVWATVI